MSTINDLLSELPSAAHVTLSQTVDARGLHSLWHADVTLHRRAPAITGTAKTPSEAIRFAMEALKEATDA